MTQLLDPISAYSLWAQTYPPVAHNALMLAEERALLSLLPTRLGDMTVADVGCGTGRYMHHALERGATRVTGLDITFAMLSRATDDGSRNQFILGDVARLPLRDAIVDVIICGLMLGHVPTLPHALGECARILKATGIMLCSDFHPIGQSLGWQRIFKANGQKYAVTHTTHQHDDWQMACAYAGLRIAQHMDAFLDPDDIPPNTQFDVRALSIPVAHVYLLQHAKAAR